MSVIEVGGKTQFGPWVRLLEGFANKTSGERPISWLVASDSGDAVADTLRGLNDAGITVPAEVRTLAGRIPQQTTDGHVIDAVDVAARTSEVNAAARVATPAFGLQFVPVDLEFAALSTAKATTARNLAADFGATAKSVTELTVFLGSKGGGAKPNDKGKAPWMRERLAATLPWSEVSMEIKHILWEWARLAHVQLDITLPVRPAELSEPVKRGRKPPTPDAFPAGDGATDESAVDTPYARIMTGSSDDAEASPVQFGVSEGAGELASGEGETADA